MRLCPQVLGTLLCYRVLTWRVVGEETPVLSRLEDGSDGRRVSGLGLGAR